MLILYCCSELIYSKEVSLACTRATGTRGVYVTGARGTGALPKSWSIFVGSPAHKVPCSLPSGLVPRSSFMAPPRQASPPLPTRGLATPFIRYMLMARRHTRLSYSAPFIFYFYLLTVFCSNGQAASNRSRRLFQYSASSLYADILYDITLIKETEAINIIVIAVRG